MGDFNRQDRLSALNVSRTNCHVSETSDSAANSATITSSAAVRGTLFDRLWRRVRRNPRSSTCSTDSSPALSPTPDRHASPLFGSLDTTQDSAPTGVRLIDTQVVKGPNGFGLTLAELITFIPSRMVGLNFFPCFSPDKVGFYQRLLQIRNISDAHVTTMYAVQPQTPSSTSVRPGDILLAVGGHRLAGCSPEYAVRILAAVPVGGIVPVTLLRGIPLAPVNITQDQQDLPVKFGDCVLQPVKQVVVPQSVLSQNTCNSCDQYAGQTKTTTAHSNRCFADQLNNSLEPGDELIEINHVNVESYKDHHSIMQEMNLVPVGQSVQFIVVRDNTNPKGAQRASKHLNSSDNKFQPKDSAEASVMLHRYSSLLN
ncbi:hypothetical protein PHET_01945 [Paragonimus heterotremus]|uniref:PDZ domain-containing protein n=1 Tax=Paragonimus heterotremus TaxID=100268 RepID=A0A8J4TQY4_9TREM|nr:hypothetical protein PHET_01945 [Paragonimus heterotremus]